MGKREIGARSVIFIYYACGDMLISRRTMYLLFQLSIVSVVCNVLIVLNLSSVSVACIV